jgi:hypothetical protein
MSLTSYRAAPSRGKAVFVDEGFVTVEDVDYLIHLVDLATTYSPVP